MAVTVDTLYGPNRALIIVNLSFPLICSTGAGPGS